MSMKSVLSRWLPLALSERLGLIRSSFVPNDSWRYWGFRRDVGIQSDEAYEKVGWVYACVRAIARNVSQVPVYAAVQARSGQGRVERLPDSHPFSQLLASPNEEEDFSGILESTALHLSLRGEGFWELEGLLAGDNGKPRPARIFSRPSQWLWKVEIENDAYKTFRLRLPQVGSLIDIPGDSGVLFKYMNSRDPWRGMSPLAAAYQAADTYYAAQLFNANAFSNGGVPGLVIGFDKDSPVKRLDKDVRERMREEAKIFYAGLNNARGIMVTGPGETVKDFGAATKDMDFSKLMQFERDEILAVYGVPPIILGHVENANRANSADQRRMFWEETVIPIVEDIASLTNRKVAPRFGRGVFAKFDYAQVPAMRKDLEQLGKGVLPWVEGGTLKINEARQEYLDKEPVPWGDEWWHESNLVGTDGPFIAPEPVAPKLPEGAEPATDGNGKISVVVARRLLMEWKNSTLSRIRDGARTPLEAFPPAREAKKAVRKFGLPGKMSWELARAVNLELSVYWETLSPKDGAEQLFEESLKRIPRGGQNGSEGA